jgi:ATP synthase protein I
MDMTLQDSKKDIYKSLLNYSALGLEMGFCVVIGLLAGHYLDKYFNTAPYLTFVFMIFGIVAAFRAVYSAYKKLKKDEDEGNPNR